MTYFRQLVACLSPKNPGFVPRPVRVEFVMDKVALGHVCLRVYILILSQQYHPINALNSNCNHLPPILYHFSNWQRR